MSLIFDFPPGYVDISTWIFMIFPNLIVWSCVIHHWMRNCLYFSDIIILRWICRHIHVENQKVEPIPHPTVCLVFTAIAFDETREIQVDFRFPTWICRHIHLRLVISEKQRQFRIQRCITKLHTMRLKKS